MDNNENKDNNIENKKETEDMELGIFRDKVFRYASYIMLGITVFAVVWLSFQVILLSQFIYAKDTTNDNKESMLQIMSEIDSLYETQYIGSLEPDNDKVSKEQLAIEGYALGYNDKYGYYLPPEQAAEVADEQAEKLVGIGVETVREKDIGYYIIRTMSDSPAKESGLKPGDYILKANGVDSKEVENSDFVKMIRGEPGTTVTLTLSNGDDINNTRDVVVTRREVVNESVTTRMIGDTAIIKIIRFTQKTEQEFKDIMDDYKKQGVEKYVIDLRDNTGGLADAVIGMLDYMLPEGLIAKFITKDNKDDKEYNSDASEFEGEFVILVNQSTASASELFSKAMQDYDKATIIGTNTFGKGTVITTYGLSNGGTLTLSTAKYYTKSNDEIEEVGIIPDIEVELTEEQVKTSYKLKDSEDTQMQEALKCLGTVE